MNFKKIVVLVFSLLYSSVYLYAYNFSAVCSTGQTLYYKVIDAANRTVAVVPPSSIGVPERVYEGYTKPTGSLVIPSIVEYGGLNYTVIKIENYAFYDCTGLKKIYFGDSITTCGQDVFKGCHLDYCYIGISFQSASLSLGGEIFTLEFNAKNCVNCSYKQSSEHTIQRSIFNCVDTLIIGDSVQSIPVFAFSHNTSSTSSISDYFPPQSGPTIIIYNAINCRNIHSTAFQNFCHKGSTHGLYYDYYLYNGAYPYESKNRVKTVIIGDNVKNIPDNLFNGWKSLEGMVSLPNSLNSTGVGMFANSTLDSIVFGSNITLINSQTFQNCANLKSVILPNSICSIGNYAFENCSQLQNINIPDSTKVIGINAFKDCSMLSTVSLGRSILSIGSSAFENCSKLQNIIIPDSTKTISENAFKNCSRLETLTFGRNLQSIGLSSFENCSNLSGKLIIPITVDSIGTNAFKNTNIDTVVVGDGVRIMSGAFVSCAQLKYCYIGKSVINMFKAFDLDTNISTVVFAAKNCENMRGGDEISVFYHSRNNLRSLSVGDSVYAIPDYAFKNCSNITSEVNLSDIQSSGIQSFYNCSNCSIVLPLSFHSIGSAAFYNCDYILSLNINNASCSIGDSAFYGCDRLVTVDLGDSTTTIGKNAFKDCFRMNSLLMGNSVKTIGDNAFEGCVRLPMPKLSNALTYIGANAFNGCSLFSGGLTIPSKVDTIGDNAFSGCSGITSLIMRPQNPPVIFANTFNSVNTNIPVYVPCGRVLYYYVTNYWENFPNLLESQPFEVYVSSNNELMGTAVLTSPPTCSNLQAVITASANSGFHFVRWSDGSMINPRLLSLTQDTTLEAEFAVNEAYVTVHSCDTIKGTVTGSGLYTYRALAVLTATANSTYHFLRWSDGNTDNPRYVFATQDTAFTAVFVSNASYIAVGNFNPTMGTVSGSGLYYYLQQISIMATPTYGYHFVQWDDGNMQNPRSIIVDCDTSFTAYFAPNIYTVSINCNNSSRGTTTGTGNYHYNMFISFSATPNYGYHFTQWNDGNTNNPRTLTVIQDTAFTAQFAANTYQISVLPNDPIMGNAFGAGTYTYNTQTTISAMPTYGYHFVQWNDGNTENPRTVSVTQNAQYEAQFEVNFYTISVSSTNPAIGSAAGGGNYSYSSIINLVATPNYGYHFTQWSDGNTDNPRTVTVMQNATYTAQFAINSYSVAVTENNVAMGVTAGNGSYIYNTLATISATPYYGYHFTQWNDGNTENPRTVVVTQNLSYTAQFDYNNYNVSVLSNNITAGYTVGSGTYNYNAIVALSAIPSNHYHFVNWRDGILDNPRNIIVSQDTIYTAIFAIDQHNVNVTSSNPAMGGVLGSGTYNWGTSLDISAIPNYGYHFTQWSDGNTQNPRHITVNENVEFSAQFAINSYEASILSNDTVMGTVSGSGTYNYLTQLTLSATPKYGYHFVQWNDGSHENPRTISLTRDTVLMAQFAINMYYVDITSNNLALGTTAGSGSYTYQSQVVISATANEHCHFVQWSDGSTSNPRQITITNDIALTAMFAEDERFIVYVNSNDENMGQVVGGGEYYAGTSISVSAIPNDHHLFVQWSDGVTDNPRTITVLENVTYTALFAPMTYDIVVASSNESMGSVSGGGTYAYGSTVQLQATANAGYHFVCWNDGDSNTVRTVAVTQDAVYMAIFADGVSIDNYVNLNLNIYPNPTTGIVHIAAEGVVSTEVLDLSGRLVAKYGDESQIDLSGLADGVYLFKIRTENGMVERKVVKR